MGTAADRLLIEDDNLARIGQIFEETKPTSGVKSIVCIISARQRSSMKSSTMTRHDGGRPDTGVPTGESGDGNGESEVGYHAQASLPDESTWAPSPRKAQKGANFRGNKANRLLRMSNLTQK